MMKSSWALAQGEKTTREFPHFLWINFPRFELVHKSMQQKSMVRTLSVHVISRDRFPDILPLQPCFGSQFWLFWNDLAMFKLKGFSCILQGPKFAAWEFWPVS